MQKEKRKNYKKIIIVSSIFLLLLFGSVLAFSTLRSPTARVIDSPSNLPQEINFQEETEEGLELPLIINSYDVSEKNEIINNILSLRDVTRNQDIISIAKYYSKLEDVFREGEHEKSWRRVADCSYSSCVESYYLDLIYNMLLSEQRNQEITQLIETVYLWSGKNEALFSESLTKTNDLLLQDSSDIVSAWQEIVDCNGCNNKEELTIALIATKFN